jgi:putative hydrolase of the HAD superfamily
MFEDECRNLKVPSQLGMKTVFISPEQKVPNYVDITHPNLEIFLSKLVEVCFPERLNALH